MVTSISPGQSVPSKVNWVPQAGQKLRVPFGLERKRVGAPATNRSSDGRTLNQVTNGAPVVRRQIEQWQLVSWNGVPVTS